MIQPTDGEALSALLSGDLPEPEAALLRARLGREPDLAALAETLCGLDAALDALPEAPPPPGLNDRVLGEARRPRGLRRTPTVAVLALAASALISVLLHPARPVLRLEAGSQRVTGEAELLAGGSRIAVDGDAKISLEPDVPSLRAMRAEVPMKSAAAAAAGVLVTVAVYQGKASIWASDGAAPVEVRAGETKTIGKPSSSAPVVEAAPVAPPSTLAEANARIDDLQGQLKAAKLEAALARGQLAQVEGTPQPFPADTPAAMGPKGFSDTVSRALTDLKLPARLVDTDCDEFPCIAYLEPTGDNPHFEQDLQPLPATLAKQFYKDNAGIMAMGTEKQTPSGAEHLFAISVVPGDAAGPDASSRTQQRVQDYTEGRMPEDLGKELNAIGYSN